MSTPVQIVQSISLGHVVVQDLDPLGRKKKLPVTTGRV